MSRESAIEAAVKAIEALRFTATAEDFAAAAVDAAAPHLVGEPVGYGVTSGHGDVMVVQTSVAAAERFRRVLAVDPARTTLRVVALVPVEDQP